MFHKRIVGLLLGVGLLLATAGLVIAQPRSLGIEVWTDRGDDAVYKPGDEMQVKVRANDDCYMLVYQIDSDGSISVLYPWRRTSGPAS